MIMSAPLPNVDTNNPLGLIIVLASIILVPLLSFLTTRQANKQAAKQQAITQAQTLKSADTEGWTKLIETTQKELARLSERIEGLEQQGEEDRQRISDLELKFRNSEAKYRVALQYIHDIIEWTKLLLNNDSVPPPAPALISEDLKEH